MTNSLYLILKDDFQGTHSSSTKRIAQILIKNYDPEDFIYHSNGQELRKQLILSIHAFCKDNLTYIFNLLPAVTAPPEELITMGKQKFGYVSSSSSRESRLVHHFFLS